LNQKFIAFDSNRAPMWGDFYGKAGGTGNPSYAYNVHLGTAVSNPHDIDGTPVDGGGNPLHKIVVPNTIPEPSSLVLALLAAGVTATRVGRRRAVEIRRPSDPYHRQFGLPAQAHAAPCLWDARL
jgi:hypothetical protein